MTESATPSAQDGTGSGPAPPWSEPRVAIVTGGAAGIGAAISARLASDGAAVAVFDLDEAGAKGTAEQISADGGTALALAVDISDRAQIEAAVGTVRQEFGAPTILVNNAGVAPFKKFREIERSELDLCLAVNVVGTFDCCQVVAEDMVEAGWGRIVNIASSSAQTGSAFQVHYSASKGAVIAMSRSLALALGPKGITVNVVPPSFIDTPGLRAGEEAGFLNVEKFEPMIPLRRVGQPDDIAAAVAFLCRDDAAFITGQVLGVNGGRVMS